MPVNVMWIKAPSSVSSVTRRSSSKVPSALAVTQSPPPASTLPRRRSPSNEPPVTGKIVVEPISWVADVARRSTMSGREAMAAVTSEHLVDRVDGTVRTAIAGRDRDEAIEKRVRRMRRLETRHGAEVIRRGGDRLAASERRNYLGR